MKSKEEILKRNTESIAKCNVKYNVTHQGILNAMEEYATLCQKDFNKDLYSKIENLIVIWSNDGTKTAGTLTRQIMELLNK